jgi:hypothetical protein
MFKQQLTKYMNKHFTSEDVPSKLYDRGYYELSCSGILFPTYLRRLGYDTSSIDAVVMDKCWPDWKIVNQKIALTFLLGVVTNLKYVDFQIQQ